MPVAGVLAKVRRHDRRRPTIEGKRRGQHPPIAKRHEFGQSGRIGGVQDLDRIKSSRRRPPRRMFNAGRLATQGLAGRDAVGGGQPRPLGRRPLARRRILWRACASVGESLHCHWHIFVLDRRGSIRASESISVIRLHAHCRLHAAAAGDSEVQGQSALPARDADQHLLAFRPLGG